MGSFDGVHKGHQELIRRTVNMARDDGLKSAVFTFSTHPRNLTKNGVKGISYNEEKEQLIEALGVDYLVNVPFEERIMKMPPEKYVSELLLGKMNMQEAYCGFNYRYGFKAQGTPETMMRMSMDRGFGFHMMEPYKIDGNVVSSTLVRTLIEEGRVDEIDMYLGRNYQISGTVIRGNQLGSTIGFATANIPTDDDMVSPANGVYNTYCTVDGVRYPAVTNVGNKPTVGIYAKNVETHILNYSEVMYGKHITVEFLKMTRPEQKFGSLQELKEQIARDTEAAKVFHGLK